VFLLYINDLSDAVSEGSTTRLFADDCERTQDIALGHTRMDRSSGGFHSFHKNLLCAVFKENGYPLVGAMSDTIVVNLV
jgi:hypothetical protein